MEIVGVGFDPNSFSKNRTLLTKQLAALGNEAEKIIGHPVLLTSPQQVAKAIYDELKLSSSGKSKLTPSGKQSTNEAALVKLKHPFVDIVLAYRQIAKYLSSWLDPSSLAKHALHENFRDHDNPGKELRIHASWLQNGTATGRLACKEPNLQNLPREPLKVRIESDDIFVTVRNAIRAKEGYTLIGSDYSQIEMRILAHMTGDKKLKQFFEEGRDIHLLISSHALGKSIDKVTPQERASFKQVVFGILYGMGSKTLSEILKVSLREAQQFIDAFLGKFPTVRNFIQTTQKNAKEKSEIRTLLGRRRCIDFSEPGKGERQSVNSVIQGSAADVIKIAMIKIDEAISKDEHGCKDCRLVLQLHDELVYEVPIDKVDGMKKLLKQYMEGAISLNVPLTSTVEEGPYWGEMTECKKDN